MFPKENRRSWDEIHEKAVSENWEEMPTRCHLCEMGAVQYGEEDVQGNRYDEHWHCTCSWCNASWWEPQLL